MTPSPYLSLRQAVRPAILAYQVLAQEQERAGKLVAECEELLALTRELLRASGQAQALERIPVGDPQARILDAYADAGMLWAKVVASSMVLATALLDQGNLDEVRRLADFFADAGEKTVAADLRMQLGEVVLETFSEQLSRVNNKMTPDEIRVTITALQAILREVPEDSPGRNSKVNSYLPPLAASIHGLMKKKNIEISYDSRVEHIASGGVAKYHDIVGISLDELSSEFEETWPE
jgi:hypothetical protein